MLKRLQQMPELQPLRRMPRLQRRNTFFKQDEPVREGCLYVLQFIQVEPQKANYIRKAMQASLSRYMQRSCCNKGRVQYIDIVRIRKSNSPQKTKGHRFGPHSDPSMQTEQ